MTKERTRPSMASSNSAYSFRPRSTLKRARWGDESDSSSSSSSSSSSASDSESAAEDGDSDDGSSTLSASSKNSTAATSDVDDMYDSKSELDDLSETDSIKALDRLDSSDEEWGATPSRRAKHSTKHAQKRRRRRADASGMPSTPRKRQALDANGVPVPSSASSIVEKKRILGTISRAPNTLPARPRALDTLCAAELAGMTTAQRAKRLLHVGATPESLPCREEQFDEVLACLEDAVQEGLGGCVYVSGVPGTGKTATVREVIRSLQRRQSATAELGDEDAALPVKPFNFVEINGMKLQDAHDAYGVLWHALTGVRCSNAVALYRLSRHFGTRLHTKAQHRRKRRDATPDFSESEPEDEYGTGGDETPRKKQRRTTVVLLDELDQMVTTRQDVMYNFFNWPNGPDSRLVVVAVANTMDLPERVLHAKVASRLGMTRITFRPYTDRQLVQIVQARLGIDGAEEKEQGAAVHGCAKVFASDAIVYLAKRVSNVSGDARRMLDVCRRAIDAHEERAAAKAITTATAPAPPPITIADMKRVLDAMVKSGKGAHICHLATHAKVALVAILQCVRRAGTAEVDLATITATHISLCRMHAIQLPQTFDASVTSDLGRLHVIANIVSQLCALGLVIAVGSGVASAKSGKFARYVLACSDVEARSALEQDADVRLRGML